MLLSRSRRHHRRSAPPGGTPPAANGVRLHRRRRRARMDAEGEQPRLHRRVVPPAIGGGNEAVRPVHDRPRPEHRCAVHPRARRQQPDVLSARRRGSCRSGRRCRHHLHAVDALRLQDGRRQEATTGDAWYQLYLVGGRDVAMGAIARAKKCRLQGARRHDRYAGGRHARARFAQRREGAARAQPVDGAASGPDDRQARLAVFVSSATAD